MFWAKGFRIAGFVGGTGSRDPGQGVRFRVSEL